MRQLGFLYVHQRDVHSDRHEQDGVGGHDTCPGEACALHKIRGAGRPALAFAARLTHDGSDETGKSTLICGES